MEWTLGLKTAMWQVQEDKFNQLLPSLSNSPLQGLYGKPKDISDLYKTQRNLQNDWVN